MAANEPVVRHRRRADEDVLELPHVARPRLRAQVLERARLDHRRRADVAEQARAEERNVLGAIAQRWDVHADLRDAKVEILAEAALVDLVS